MPIYLYRCSNKSGEHTFERGQSILDTPVLLCEVCQAPVRRVIQPVGISFRGSGFYKTDSRSISKSPKPASKPKVSSDSIGIS